MTSGKMRDIKVDFAEESFRWDGSKKTKVMSSNFSVCTYSQWNSTFTNLIPKLHIESQSSITDCYGWDRSGLLKARLQRDSIFDWAVHS